MIKKINPLFASAFVFGALLISVALSGCMGGDLAKTAYLHPWQVKPGQLSEMFSATDTVFFTNDRYLVVSAAGKMTDQGYLEIDDGSRTMLIKNPDASVRFKVDGISKKELLGEMAITSSFGVREGIKLTLVPATGDVKMPSPANIYEAAEWGDTDAIKKFLTDGAAVNAVSEDGLTLLMLASYYGHPKAVSLLLQNDANTELTSPNLKTALILAVESDNIKGAKALIEKGARVDAQREDGETPVSIAVGHHSLELTRMLLKAGADPNSKDMFQKPLLIFGMNTFVSREKVEAAADMEMVKLLVENGADINATDGAGATALYVAAGYGMPDVVKYLISKGAKTDITAQTISGELTLQEWVDKSGQREKIGPLLVK